MEHIRRNDKRPSQDKPHDGGDDDNKSFGKSASPCTFHSRECTRLLRALLAVHSAAGTLYPHRSATCVIYVTLCCPILPPKMCPFPNWRYYPQSSHWNNGKMKTAGNSAYVQTETLNYTFTQQAVFVCFYFCSNFQEIAIPTSNVNKCKKKLQFLHNVNGNRSETAKIITRRY